MAYLPFVLAGLLFSALARYQWPALIVQGLYPAIAPARCLKDSQLKHTHLPYQHRSAGRLYRQLKQLQHHPTVNLIDRPFIQWGKKVVTQVFLTVVLQNLDRYSLLVRRAMLIPAW